VKPRTLIFVPHADNESLALSGYLQRFQRTENIYIIIFSSGNDPISEKFQSVICDEILEKFNITYLILDFKACYFNNVRDKLSKIIEGSVNNFKPNKILMCGDFELHQDYKTINHLCKIASKTKIHNFIKEIYEYSVPESEQFSSTYFDTVLQLSPKEMMEKLQDVNKYTTEYLPTIPNCEFFRTVFRRL